MAAGLKKPQKGVEKTPNSSFRRKTLLKLRSTPDSCGAGSREPGTGTGTGAGSREPGAGSRERERKQEREREREREREPEHEREPGVSTQKKLINLSNKLHNSVKTKT